MSNTVVSVRDFGAVGDGVNDDFAAIQAALDSGAREVIIPFGTYPVSKTLKVHSNTKVRADRCAKIILRAKCRLGRGDFLLSNASLDEGNVNITIEGGIWDGNNTATENAKPDIFDKSGYSGSVLNFYNVKGLTLRSITVANSTTYYTRICRVEDFVIEDIDFVSDEFGHNQDGLHFGGAVRHGKVKNVRALSSGQTNDDMVALNADDSVERVENLDLVRDDIEDITFENIYAENCYTIIRMLSVTAKIRNIKFKNVYAGYRNYAINGDGARYCKTPLFSENEYPLGIGCIENIEIENFVCYPVTEAPARIPNGQVNPEHALHLEGHCDRFKIKNFRLLDPVGSGKMKAHALYISKVPGSSVTADGKEYTLVTKEDELLLDSFNNIEINSNLLKSKR